MKEWQECHADDEPLTEESVWQAIAEANDMDCGDISDGDLIDWI